MHVDRAHPDDILPWLELAREVEVCFGPLDDEPGFCSNLLKNIERDSAICIRENDGPPGTPLMGGLMFGPKPPKYELAWLAVAERWRRHGVAEALVKAFFGRVIRPAKIVLLTFADTEPIGQPATAFYKALGFIPGEYGPITLTGVRTQVFRYMLDRPPTARAVIQHEERVLLVQHHYVNPENNGKWSLPGGRIDDDDPDPITTLRRELNEELGLELDVKRNIVRALGTFQRDEQMHHIYLVQPPHLDFHVEETEIAGLGWFTLDEVRDLDANGKLLAVFIRQAVEASFE